MFKAAVLYLLMCLAVFPFLVDHRVEASQQTIDSVRAVLAQRESGNYSGNPAVEGMPLNGYNFHWEIGIGKSRRVIVISCNLKGLLLAFDSKGTLVARKSTDEITALQIFDLDSDGIAEILTEDSTKGTGIIEKKFHLYKIGDKIEELWNGESYYRSVPWSPETRMPKVESLRIGLVRFDDATLTHILRDIRSKKCVATTYHFENNSLKLISRTPCEQQKPF